MSYGMDTADYIDSLKARLAAAEAERDALRAAAQTMLAADTDDEASEAYKGPRATLDRRPAAE
jgi:alkanesulfonate monooxygenase SsuD/methylene tetrahydromethanopterin reductase-like flavin-dependent oxidoreductase (luciferase family)